MDARGTFTPHFSSTPTLLHPIVLVHNATQRDTPQAPEICTLYCLDVPPSAVRAVIRQRFEKNRYASDPKLIDVLIHKSRQEYQEAVNFWKQEPHVLGPLLSNRDRPHRTFLQKFYEGGYLTLYPIRSPPLTHLGPVSVCMIQGEMRMPSFPHRPMCNIPLHLYRLFFQQPKMRLHITAVDVIFG
jgi:hypothetical protein